MKKHKLFFFIAFLVISANVALSQEKIKSHNFIKISDFQYHILIDQRLEKKTNIVLKQTNNSNWKLIFSDDKSFTFVSYLANLITILDQKNNDCIFLHSQNEIDCIRNKESYFNEWILKNNDKTNSMGSDIFIIFLPQYFFYILLIISYSLASFLLINLIRIKYVKN